MHQAFIVTPFGLKHGINFSDVVEKLIARAIKAIGFTGGTTGEIIRQGNIRTDMFQKLLVADLVIADVSIHDANAFYGLGARHAFREKRTVLIRCSRASLPAEAKFDEMPFDLQTDRNFEYDLNDLRGSCVKLIAVLKRTIMSGEQDSPICQLLPKLGEYDTEDFLTMPRDFRETVEAAAAAGWAGDLSLLAEEAGSFEWGVTGLRLIGHSLFQMNRMELARAVWERVREKNGDDPEANLLLGMIDQRLGDFLRSEQTLERTVDSPKIDQANRAEAPAPHVILFTGHRIDAPGRKTPRFPAAKEPVARECIKTAIVERLAQISGSAPRGLAGAANGGDILFLEVCAELGIPTDLYLALPPDPFGEASVKDSVPAWERRYEDLVAKHPGFRTLSESRELPAWLREKPDYDLWKRNNLWMLRNAIAIAGRNITLIALWNCEGGDGAGGTEDMVNEVKKLGARTIIIDTKKEFKL